MFRKEKDKEVRDKEEEEEGGGGGRGGEEEEKEEEEEEDDDDDDVEEISKAQRNIDKLSPFVLHKKLCCPDLINTKKCVLS